MIIRKFKLRKIFAAILLLMSLTMVRRADFDNFSNFNPIISISSFAVLMWLFELQTFLVADFKKNFSYKLFLASSFMIASTYLAGKTGWTWFLKETVDPATFIFFTFLPLIYIYRLSSKLTVFLTVSFIFMTAVFSIDKFAETTEVFTILSFFSFAAAAVQKIFELSKNGNYMET